MAMYDWQKLLAHWEQEKLTVEQAIGQLLQWGQEATRTFARQAQLERLKHRIVELADRIDALERRLEVVESCRKRRGKGRTTTR